MLKLPSFQYYADPAAQHVFEVCTQACECCGQAKGIRYTGPFYSIGEHEQFCPDCIADGSAARKFDGQFNDIVVEWENDDGSMELVDESAKNVAADVLDELLKRTPGYSSWQGNIWMFHCDDGCVFHGEADHSDVTNPSPETVQHWENQNGEKWSSWMKPEKIGMSVSAYKFACRHCELVLFHWDMD